MAGQEAVLPIQPHFFVPDVKSPDPKVDFLKSLKPYVSDATSKKTADTIISSLGDTYKAFTACLVETSVSDEGFTTAFKDYISVLLVLINSPSPSSSAAATAPATTKTDDVDAALDAATTGAATAGAATAGAATAGAATAGAAAAGDATAKDVSNSSTDTQSVPSQSTTTTLTGDSPLRYAIKFSWNQVLVKKMTTEAAHVPDAIYELASALVAGAIWYIRRAGNLCESTPTGITSETSGQAYKLLRQAAGIFDFVIDKCLPLCVRSNIDAAAAPDATVEVLRAASACAVADAQSFTVLRAISKGNQPSLIASLARDTRDQYQEAGAVLARAASGAASSKLSAYLAYKREAFEAYAQIFNGIEQWKAGQAGAGLRSLKDAETAWFSLKKAANVYDKAAPSSLGKLHSRFDDVLDKVLYDTLRRVERENTTIYYQKLPATAAPLPEGKRLAGAAEFAVPEKAKVVNEVSAATFTGAPASADAHGKKVAAGGNGGASTQGGGGCMRWLCCCCVTKAAVVEVVDEAVKKNDDDAATK